MLPLDLYLKLKSNTGTEYTDQDPDLDPDPVRKVGSGSGSGQKLIGSATLLKTIAISMGGVLNRRCFVMLVFQALAFYVRTKYWCCNKDYHISYPE